MYVQETFNGAYKLFRKYWMNAILYVAPMLVLYAVAAIFGGIIYFSSFFLPLIAASTRDIGLVLTALGVVFGVLLFLALMVVSVFISLMYNRVAYLTSKEQTMAISMKSLHSLFEYAKENFVQFLKLNLLEILAILFIILVLGLLFFIPAYLQLIPPIAVVLIGTPTIIIMGLLVYVIFSTAVLLFFMGNENIGTINLVKMGWKLFATNFVEYILFGLALLATYIVYFAVVFGLGMLCLGPLSYIVGFIYSFYISIALFVFIEKISGKKKKQNS